MTRRIVDRVLIWLDDEGIPSNVMDKDLGTEPVEVDECNNLTAAVYHTAGSSPVGVFHLQSRNRDSEAWITVDGSEVPVPVDDGALLYRVPTPPGKFVRIFYAFTSGTAVASGSLYGTGGS